MTQAQERRSPTASRVPLETLVEICGNEPGIPAFEAEALDVSAQGMHLRTAYLPDEGAPLVCRFEDHGREIVVEGVVAWRKESSKGGDFGVAFTALDSRSVDALRDLVKTGAGSEKETGGDAPSGSRVRLHIEGLGSPMKARIRSGGTQKIQVGSSLEFLKVGRKLEIEDLDGGGRRSAQIDGVEVVVDARTSVPQLVVALRYEGALEDTPEPTVTDLGAEPVRAQSLRIAPEAVTTDAASASSDADPSPSGDVPEAKADDANDDDDGEESDEDDDVSEALPAATRAARKVGHAAEHAGNAARDASVAAVRGMGKLFAGASAKLAALRSRERPPAKRRTAKPVEAPASLEGKRLRPQSGKSAESEPETLPAPKAHKRTAIGIALVAVAASAGAIALRPAKASKATSEARPAATALAALPVPSVTAGSTALANGVVPLPGANPLATAAGVEPSAPVVPPGSPVTANVPLFGPTPLATVEPAPLGPPPSGESKGIEAAEQSAAKASAPAIAADEEFPEPIEHVDGSKKGADGKPLDAKNLRPEDVPAWGKGKLHMPTIHRLRLDGPGAELRGVSDATGFTVLVPKRKVMEEGGPIAKRDPRIGRARTTNTPGGAQVRITFRETLPSYRVRLRRDYVEILISAPEESATKKAPAKDTKEAPKPAAAAAKPAPGKIPAAKH
ncbi:MAG TPA: PilZ domain-containing protein [Polyangiaceae bacterium]|nr:PilZ domain-containing protein [Polyangiaceae bacterium]